MTAPAHNDAPEQTLRHPWPDPPAPGTAIEVAEGVLWSRIPLPLTALNHVNVYALDDGDMWTLIDTGIDWDKGRTAMDQLLAGPLSGKPVRRVVATHHHPDHIGQIGRFVEAGAEIWTSRTAWFLGRMLTLDRQAVHTPQAVEFRRRAGVTGAALEAFKATSPYNFADWVAPIPLGFQALEDGGQFSAGGRDWTVRLGQGHAPDHVTLWHHDIVLAGDQVISGISPNIGVYATEPEADPLAGWIATCHQFRADLATSSNHASDGGPLVLPGHKLPFVGLDFRLKQLIENHASACERILSALKSGPLTAVEMMPTIFMREIGESDFGLALVEAVAHANHLYRAGRTTRSLNSEGAWTYNL